MANSLDAEIQKYLPLLGAEEKRSLIGVIKSFLHLKKEEPNRISIDQYNKEIDEALDQVKRGEYLSHDDAEKEADKW